MICMTRTAIVSHLGLLNGECHVMFRASTESPVVSGLSLDCGSSRFGPAALSTMLRGHTIELLSSSVSTSRLEL